VHLFISTLDRRLTYLCLDKEEVDEQDAQCIDGQVEDIEPPAGTRNADRRRIRVDETDDIQPQARHGQALGSGIICEDFARIEGLAGRPDEGEGEEEDVDEADAGEAEAGDVGLACGADDDHEDAEGADGRAADEHGATAGFVDEADTQEGADGHDGRLERVHEELLLGGGDAGVFGHERHVVGGWRQVDLAEEADAKDEEGAVAGGACVEELAVVVPALGGRGLVGKCCQGGGGSEHPCMYVPCRCRRS
jgi:hypothetical protein